MKVRYLMVAVAALTLLTSINAQALTRQQDGVQLGPDDRPITAGNPKPNPKCLEWISKLNAAEMDVATQSEEFAKIVRKPAGGGVDQYRLFRQNVLAPKSGKYIDALKNRAIAFDKVKALQCPRSLASTIGRIPDEQK